jgi:hypothetical protein
MSLDSGLAHVFSLTKVFGQTRVRMSRQPLAVVGWVFDDRRKELKREIVALV